MTKQERITQLEAQIKSTRKLQYNASQMRRASGVFKCERQLEKLYRELDALRAS
jgi:hypothetical protein